MLKEIVVTTKKNKRIGSCLTTLAIKKRVNSESLRTNPFVNKKNAVAGGRALVLPTIWIATSVSSKPSRNDD